MDHASTKKRRDFRNGNEANERNNQQDWRKCFKNFIVYFWMMNWTKIRFTKNIWIDDWRIRKRTWSKTKNTWRFEIKSSKSDPNCHHGGFDGGDWFSYQNKCSLILKNTHHGKRSFEHCGVIDHANRDLVVIKDKN